MAVLIDLRMPEFMTDDQVREELRPHLSEADIRVAAEPGDPAEVEMLVVVGLQPGMVGGLPNLRLVQKMGAGVETIVSHPELAPQVRVARLKSEAPAREIAEYCLTYVLREQRNVRHHEARQAEAVWDPVPPRPAPETAVGVLGLGHIGSRTARAFAALGYGVRGWSRTPKHIDGVDCRHGAAALDDLLGACDYVVSVLPSTSLTRGLFDAGRLARMREGAVLVNVGRGDLIDEDALLAALERGRPGAAVLDVFRREPLPAAHPLWRHPRVTVTPHVSGWHQTGGLADVAENYRRLVDGEPLLHEVDREAGY